MARGIADAPTVDAIVSKIYGGLLDDISMRPCLGTMGAAFNGHLTGLHFEEFEDRRSGLTMLGEIEGAEFERMSRDYATVWAGKNLWIERGTADLLERGYGCGDDVVSQRELMDSEYFRHFLRPCDVRHGLGINVQARGKSSIAILTINRSASAGAFSADELRRVVLLRPHLINAYAICRRLGGLRDEAATLRAAFDNTPLGVLVLDGDGRIVEVNREASRLLASNCGLARSAEGRLQFSDPRLKHCYATALVRLGNPELPLLPEVLLVDTGADVAGVLALHLCAFPRTAGSVLPHRGRILGFLSPISHRASAQMAAHVLKVAFGLTPVEGLVALSLRKHMEAGHVALELNLAMSTVRSHLKHIFRKTNTARQSELLRLIDCVLAPVPPSSAVDERRSNTH
jgi:PAS domain-containing protein/DNA-binding CsgD family transcriptional regulator